MAWSTRPKAVQVAWRRWKRGQACTRKSRRKTTPTAIPSIVERHVPALIIFVVIGCSSRVFLPHDKGVCVHPYTLRATPNITLFKADSNVLYRSDYVDCHWAAPEVSLKLDVRLKVHAVLLTALEPLAGFVGTEDLHMGSNNREQDYKHIILSCVLPYAYLTFIPTRAVGRITRAERPAYLVPLDYVKCVLGCEL